MNLVRWRGLEHLAGQFFFHPVGDGVVADAEQPFGRPLADALQVLRQGGLLFFRRHQAPILFTEGFFAARAAPALMAVPRGAVLDDVGGLAMGAVHAAAYSTPTTISIPV